MIERNFKFDNHIWCMISLANKDQASFCVALITWYINYHKENEAKNAIWFNKL